ncbi:ATP-binding protein [Actinomadura sp. NPDC048394]|uniref:ATP-binding protein n=1 Tax=Actinomadura TaxID=1988 RepID=UPI0033C66A2B
MLVSSPPSSDQRLLPEWIFRPSSTTSDVVELSLPALKTSVARARRFTADQLAAWGMGPELIDDCTLVVSELVTNALDELARSGVTIGDAESMAQDVVQESGERHRVVLQVLRAQDAFYAAVWDPGDGKPATQSQKDGLCSRGRGLVIVDCLADDSGVFVCPLGGKAVIAGWRWPS